MQDMQTAIILLSVIVCLLLAGYIVLLTVVIVLLIKLRRIADQAETAMANIADMSKWLSPTKLINELVSLFRK